MRNITPLQYILEHEDLSRMLVLWHLIDKHQLKTVLDVGCGNLWVAHWMVKAGAKVLAVDVNDRRDVKHINEVDFILGDSKDVLPTLTDKFDLVFIDGNHDYEWVASDIKQAQRLAKKFIVIHDYDLEADVTKAVNDILGEPEFVIVDHPTREKGGLVIYKV